MSAPRGDEWATASFPAGGALRVHKDPLHLPQGPWAPGTAPNRFDDPLGLYGVRYLATTLEGCLKELLARFQRDDEFETRLAAVQGLTTAAADDGDAELRGVSPPPGPDYGPDEGLEEWLSEQRYTVFHVGSPPPELVEAYDHSLLDELNTHDKIRAVLDSARAAEILSGLGLEPTLDQRVVRLSDRELGRPLTQAISRIVHDRIHHDARRYGGLGYWSRVDDTQRCWALFERTHVQSDGEVLPLSPADQLVRRALRTAADYLGLRLPQGWSEELSEAG